MTAQTFSSERTTSPGLTKSRLWAGRVISGFAALFLLFDGVTKIFKPSFVVDATVRLGFPESAIVGIGILLTACTVIYLIPRTSILGAVLVTGYLGGAVAIQLRAGSSAFETVFPVLIGILVWGGLRLRDNRVKELLV
jgi:hypothetical protein